MGQNDVLFSTPRLHFRKWKDEDRIAFRAINANEQVMEHFPSVLTSQENDQMVARINTHFADKGFSLYAVDRVDLDTPLFIGFIGLYTPRFQLDYGADWVEIGWRTHPSSWGIGLATEGAKAVLDHAFNHLSLSTVYSMTALTNHRSVRVMQKIGMKHIGYFDHPLVAADHVLCRHTLYQITKVGKC